MARLRRLILPASAGLVAAALLGFGARVFPVPMTDSVGFVPAAIFERLGAGLVNPIEGGDEKTNTRAVQVDRKGQGRFLYYPPLFPLAVAALMPTPDQRSAFLAIAVLRALTVVGFALLLARLWRKMGVDPDLWIEVGSGLAIVGMATGFMPSEGRPEAIGALLVLGGVAAALELREPWDLIGIAVAVGSIGAAAPAGAAMIVPLIGCYAAVRHATFASTSRLLAVGAGAAFASAAIIALGPFGIGETLRGMAVRSPGAVLDVGSEYPWNAWFLAGRSSFMGLLLLAAAAAGLALAIVHRRRIRSPLVFWTCAALFVGLTHFFSLRRAIPYRVQMLSPLLYGVVLVFLAEKTRRSPGSARRTTRHLFGAGVVATFALTAIGFVRYGALFASTPTWIGIEQGQRAYRASPRCPGGRVAMMTPAWMLPAPEDLHRYLAFSVREALAAADADCVLLPPAEFDMSPDLEQRGYRLTAAFPADAGAARTPRPAWLMGYAYRLYVRQGPATKATSTQ